jgi:hypothetical protein
MDLEGKGEGKAIFQSKLLNVVSAPNTLYFLDKAQDEPDNHPDTYFK